MGKIFLFNLSPLSTSLLVRYLGILVYEMLEFVNGNSVRDKGESVANVGVSILVRVLPEEAFHPRIRDKLHTHGMHLARLKCWAAVIGASNIS